jgi:hypothetical protein
MRQFVNMAQEQAVRARNSGLPTTLAEADSQPDRQYRCVFPYRPREVPSAAYGRNQTMDAFSTSYHCDCLNFTSHEHGRERMQEFTAKYADKIQGG